MPGPPSPSPSPSPDGDVFSTATIQNFKTALAVFNTAFFLLRMFANTMTWTKKYRIRGPLSFYMTSQLIFIIETLLVSMAMTVVLSPSDSGLLLLLAAIVVMQEWMHNILHLHRGAAVIHKSLRGRDQVTTKDFHQVVRELRTESHWVTFAITFIICAAFSPFFPHDESREEVLLSVADVLVTVCSLYYPARWHNKMHPFMPGHSHDHDHDHDDGSEYHSGGHGDGDSHAPPALSTQSSISEDVLSEFVVDADEVDELQERFLLHASKRVKQRSARAPMVNASCVLLMVGLIGLEIFQYSDHTVVSTCGNALGLISMWRSLYHSKNSDH